MDRVRTRSEDGFTLVEVMVAIAVLLVGVLGTVALIDGANAQTSRTKAREGATALARSVLEIARGVPYADLTSGRVLEELDARAGYADADAAPGHQVSSRGFRYTVVATVCSMDDPRDGLGEHDEIGISFCADSDTIGSTPAPIDRNPDDYRRVSVTLSWRVGSGPVDSVTQTGIVTNPVGGLGPSVLTLDPLVPSTATITGPVDVATYSVTTSTAATDVGWTVNGSRIGSAEGTDLDWTITWDLGPRDAPLVVDCTYVLGAEAFDEKGRSGAGRALTVAINRRAAFAPGGFAGGPNLRGDGDVDLEWAANRECDIEGYHVYRGVDGGPVDTLVCEIGQGEATACVDESPPDGALSYEVAALDRDPGGDVRVGDRSVAVQVPADAENAAPPPPAELLLCTGGSLEGPCDDIEGNPAPDGTAVLSWPLVEDPDGDAIHYYRIYRDGTGYGHRLDVLYPVFDDLDQPVSPLVFVDAAATGSHQYWVTAVDERFAESVPVGPVTWAP